MTRAGGGQPEAFDFAVSTGKPGAAATTASYGAGAIAIPDYSPAGVNLPLDVSNLSGTINQLRFQIGGSSCTTEPGAETVGISHPYASDLVLKLTSPQGTIVTLFDSAGGDGVNFCNLTLADDATGGSVQDLIGANAPYTGTARPANALAAFRGENPNGTWTLNVSDRVSGGVGVIRDFSLILDGYSCQYELGEPDLSLLMKAEPNPAEVGSDLLYTIIASNGQNLSTGVTVTDTLPSNVTFLSASSTQGSCSNSGSSVVCGIGSLRAYGLAVINIHVKPNATGTITNTASVTSNEADANAANHTTSQSVTARQRADLMITNVDSADPIPMGGSTTYNIKATNNGPSPASGALVTVRSDQSGVQTFNIGNLAVNASHTITTSGLGSAAGTISNTATVTANEEDPRPENNTAAQSTRIVTLQRLHLSISSLPGCADSFLGTTRGTVFLNSAAPPGGAVVTLSNSNPKITMPGSVTIEAGGSFAKFDIDVNGIVDSAVTGAITATYAGTSNSKDITVRPVSLHYINPVGNWTGIGGHPATFTAELECGESENDIAVSLSSENPDVAYISSPANGVLIFSPGTTSRSFTVGTRSVTATTYVKIKASANGKTVEEFLMVTPP